MDDLHCLKLPDSVIVIETSCNCVAEKNALLQASKNSSLPWTIVIMTALKEMKTKMVKICGISASIHRL